MSKGLVGALLVALVLITYTDLTAHTPEFVDAAGNDRGLPIPAPRRYVDALVVYGLLGLLAIAAPTFAAVLGWGVLLPLAFNVAGGGPVGSDLRRPVTGAKKGTN